MSWQRGVGPVKIGIVAIIVIAAGAYLGFTKSIPFRPHFEIKAAFRTSNLIKKNSPVRIAGVNVGKVSKVEPTSPGADSAVVTMRINKAGRPIHADATAKIRPRIFLEGNFFVDLTAGSPSKPALGDNDTIPASQTATPVQLDQVLKALKAPGRLALQDTLTELAQAENAGAAKAFNKSLPDQAPAFRYTSIVLDALLGRRPHDLSGIVRDLATTADGLDRSPQALQGLIVDFDRTAAALASQRTALQATVSELPRTLAAANPALDSLNAAFPPTRRLAVSALPGVRSSLPAIRALRPFVAQLHGLVGKRELRGLARDLRATTPSAVRLARTTVPLLGQLRPLASCLNNTVLPWSEDSVPDKAFPATGPVFEEGAKFLPGLAGESRSFDANGQWFKVLGSGGVSTVQLGNGVFGLPLFQVEGVNPPKSARPPVREDVPCETQQSPDLNSIAAGPPATTKNDSSSPLSILRLKKAKETAVMLLREQMRESGDKRKVSTRDATPAMIEQIAKSAGNLGQLKLLREGRTLNARNLKKAGG